MHCVNLDPAAEAFNYPVSVDIRDLISLDDAMTELQLGPNGGLLYCMEYLEDHLDAWLGEELGPYGDEDYLVFDCPGQIELYSHVGAVRSLVDWLRADGWAVAAVFCMDVAFVAEPTKYIAGAMQALAAMVKLEVPHINLLTKMDLAEDRAGIEEFLIPDPQHLLDSLSASTGPRFRRLNAAVAALLDEYSLVSFVPLDVTDEDSIGDVLLQIDMALQFGEDADHVRGASMEGAEGPPPVRSRFRGLSWDKKHQGWRVRIYFAGRQRHVGRFEDELVAARAYDKAAVYLYGGCAITNFGLEAVQADPSEVSAFIMLAKEQADQEKAVRAGQRGPALDHLGGGLALQHSQHVMMMQHQHQQQQHGLVMGVHQQPAYTLPAAPLPEWAAVPPPGAQVLSCPSPVAAGLQPYGVPMQPLQQPLQQPAQQPVQQQQQLVWAGGQQYVLVPAPAPLDAPSGGVAPASLTSSAASLARSSSNASSGFVLCGPGPSAAQAAQAAQFSTMGMFASQPVAAQSHHLLSSQPMAVQPQHLLSSQPMAAQPQHLLRSPQALQQLQQGLGGLALVAAPCSTPGGAAAERGAACLPLPAELAATPPQDSPARGGGGGEGGAYGGGAAAPLHGLPGYAAAAARRAISPVVGHAGQVANRARGGGPAECGGAACAPPSGWHNMLIEAAAGGAVLGSGLGGLVLSCSPTLSSGSGASAHSLNGRCAALW
ncbi:gpn3 [Scenedesmus sp. PABB004]|nr:gpn3 [Scenedesmus sp. PABB004]